MKILMFGWEFPPHISGGLGTACMGIAKELSLLPDIELTFIVPKLWGDEDMPGVTLLGANQVPVIRRNIGFPSAKSKIQYYELSSGIIPYLGTAEYEALIREKTVNEQPLVEIMPDGKIFFAGGYGSSLLQEIEYYAMIAGKLASELDFDIIHVHDWMCFPAGMAAKRASGKPLVVHVHSTEFDRCGRFVNPEICNIEKKGLDCADRIIAVSRHTRSRLILNYHIKSNKITVVHNGVEPPVDNTEHKPSKNFGTDKIVSFLGRITTQKGPGYFVDAANIVIRQTKNVRFIMGGQGDLFDEIKQKVSLLQISGYFYFPGFIPEDLTDEFFSMSDVFVMPSVSEPFGIVALEAMQAGIPVIISKQSGVSEAVKNVIKVDYWDTQKMADSIIYLIKNHNAGIKLAQKGKREAQKMAWKTTVAKIYGLYQKLIEI